MTKAQEVRQRRIERRQHDLTVVAEGIFDWILDLIDLDTKKGYLDSTKICLFKGEKKLRNIYGSEYKVYSIYDLSEPLKKFNKIEIFSKLKEVIENEDGYEVDLNRSAVFWDSTGILLEVFVK